MTKEVTRKLFKTLFVLTILLIGSLELQRANIAPDTSTSTIELGSSEAADALKSLAIKGRAPKTGYSREMFSSGWGYIGTCDARNYILQRDLTDIQFVDTSCKVASGTLQDPYTGNTVIFIRGTDTSDDVQIDHVVALSDAWQKGAQQLPANTRYLFANDPLNLLAVDGSTNQTKGDSDAATWLPPNKAFRCQYVARQIAVKHQYSLWVTRAEYDAMARVLVSCPNQQLPKV